MLVKPFFMRPPGTTDSAAAVSTSLHGSNTQCRLLISLDIS